MYLRARSRNWVTGSTKKRLAWCFEAVGLEFDDRALIELQ